MKIIIPLLIFIFLTISCSKKESTEPAPTTGTISGTVMNKAGDEAVPSAIITTEPPTSSVSSDADGKYTIEEVDPGNYIVQAVKEGHDPGNVNVTVKAGKTSTADIRMGILLANHPPTKPQLVAPENNSEYQSIDLILQWKECADQDGDAVVYDLYFGKENPPPLDIENIDSTSVKKSNLDTATVYYWQVVAKDSKGSKTASDIRQFKTTPFPIPTEGLVAYYPFNGNANDESGNGNDGTVHGATLVVNRFNIPNSAYYFDGINDYIEMLHNLKGYGIISKFTMVIWINSDDSPNWHMLLEDGTQFNNSTFYLGVRPQEKQLLVRLNTTNTSYFNDNIPVPEFRGHWTFLAYLYDGSSIRLYFNCVQVFKKSITGDIKNGNRNLRIGFPSGEKYYKGFVDDIRFYNRALSATEIENIFHEGGWGK